jgi:hypothetical protein
MATFGTFVANQTLTAAELNTAGAWQAYTPTWTQDVVITKTVDWGRFTQLGKLVIANIKMTASSAGTSNNKILVGLPVAASSNNGLMGIMWRTTTTMLTSPLAALYESSTTIAFSFNNLPPTNITSRLGQNDVNNASYAVASGNIFYINLTYEAA